jgi:tRNA (guanine37-N1)-methyltransferase
MRFIVVTLFREIFASLLSTALVGRAVEAGLIQVDFVDPRDFTHDRHRTVDDTPYGGGEGMVMKPEPLVDALESIARAPAVAPGSAIADPAPDVSPAARPHRVLLTPQGEVMAQRHLVELAARQEVVLVCGRYEGFDERVRDFVDQELSLGDFVLNGGEVAAMAIIDGVARLVPGVIGKPGSLTEESHTAGLLEYPHYTRPRSYRGRDVPEVLVSGDHAEIRRWRRQQMLLRTRRRRPDLWRAVSPSDEDRELLKEIPDPADLGELAARTYVALLHYPVRDRLGQVVTSAITNLDLHDIARSSRTYGLAGYFVVTPLTRPRERARRICAHWRTGHGASYNKRRREALTLLDVASDLAEVQACIEEREGCRAVTLVTSAIDRPGQMSRGEVLRRLLARRSPAAPDGAQRPPPLLILLGTGWGLTEDVTATADLALQPVKGPVVYNHLSVRSAAAILLDRFFGMRD